MKKVINCNNCKNPFGYLEGQVLEIDYKRVNDIEHDFKKKECSLKCRKCAYYSTLAFNESLLNELDLKKTSKALLG